MRALKTTLEKLAKKATIEDCVEMALAIFYRNFRDKILDLTANFPEDAKDKDGNDFWTGHKKFPAAAEYDGANEDHVNLMISMTNLIACMIKIHEAKPPSEQNDPDNRWKAEFRSPEWINGIIASLPVPAYVKGSFGGAGMIITRLKYEGAGGRRATARRRAVRRRRRRMS